MNIIEQRKIGLDELRKIQLFIMDELDDYCRIHNIQYFLLAGSLIGAVRHKGYIPWDDDIDIGLLRKDYETLLQKFISKSGNVEILSAENAKNYIYPYAKAIHNQTILIESDEKHSIGVNVDIFPIDVMPPTLNECIKLNNKIQLYQSVLTLKYLQVNKTRSISKNAIILVGRLFKMVPDKWLIKKICQLHLSENRPSDYVSTLTGIYGIREVVKKKVFSECIEADFEGRQYLIPCGYDELLTNQYGDYMQLPPEEKRVSTHSFVAYWK